MKTEFANPQPTHRSADMALLAGLSLFYALLVKVVVALFSVNGVVSVVWPPSGVALAALLIGGRKYSPAVFIGALAGSVVAGSPFPVSVAIAFGNTLAALVGAGLLVRISGFDRNLTRPRDFVWLLIAGAAGSCVSAAIGASTLLLMDLPATRTLAQNLLQWWQSDTLGVVLFSPLLLVWRDPPRDWLKRARLLESVACFGLCFLAGGVIFMGWYHDALGLVVRGYWIFLFVVWSAARFGRHGVTLIIGMTAMQVLLGTMHGIGLFSNDFVQGGMFNFWFYMLALAVTGLSLALTIERDRKLADATLSSNEERLKIATESGRIAVWEVDLENNRLIWDDTCFVLYKMQRETFGGTFEEWAARLHPEDVDATVAAFQEAVAGGRRYEPEFRIVWPDGEVRHIKAYSRLIRNEAGKPVRMIGTNWDTTELKRTETALRTSEERLKLAVASGQVGIWEYKVKTGELIWDENMYALYGAGPGEFSGTYEGWSTRLHPDDRAATEAALMAAIDGVEEYAPEFRIVWPNGEVHYIKGHAQVIRDASGNPARMIGTNWDNRAHALAQHQLYLAQTAIDSSKSAFFRLSATGMVLYLNDAACQSLGYTREELLGKYVWDFDPDFPPEAWSPMWEGLRKTKVVNIETRHRRKDGTTFPVEVVGNIIYYDGEEYSFVYVRDITERKQADQQIRRLKDLYRALSEVNQAIVRMERQAELFPLVCRCAVEFGGMTMAWIAQLDEASGLMPPVASYGDRLDYLDGIVISSRADVPEGRGSCGTALRENRPVIVNDYRIDPMATPWKQRAAERGWKSHAAFPIPRGGRPFAVLNVFHAQVNAFDKEAISLLEEMSRDVSFAMENFDRELERKAAEESLRLAASVYDTSSEAMMVTDADNRIISVNPAFTAITGYVLDEIAGKTPGILKSGNHDTLFYEAMWREIVNTGKWQGEIWDRRKNGEIYPKWLTINTVYNDDGSIRRRIALFTDISQKKAWEDMIWRQANFDSLTELPNRQMFRDRLAQDLKKSHRAGLPLALMFLDLDRFKEVNDTLGHDVGDALLQEAANRLSSCVRETDTVARLGGDEFTVILSELDDPGSVDRIAQDILAKLSEPFRLGDKVIYASASIGITLYPSDTVQMDDLIKNADQAMYAAKRMGRNRCSYFTASMQEAAQTRMQIANDLRVAIAERQFRVVYQPIVKLATGTIHKAEALIRWQHPVRGLISPADFIPVAEDTGLIIEIGDWVFGEAARQVKRWRAAFHPDFQVSVNKSPAQFGAANSVHEKWLEYLHQLGLPGRSITVEITEGLLLDAGTAISDKLLAFYNAGMQLSLDDFGTGYSSLSYLKKFDIDYLKIDQSFIRNLTPGSDDLALCEAIIVMAHKLSIRVIAEGVETEEQRALLMAIGCDYAQGYLFSKPVDAEGFERLLGRNSDAA